MCGHLENTSYSVKNILGIFFDIGLPMSSIKLDQYLMYDGLWFLSLFYFLVPSRNKRVSESLLYMYNSGYPNAAGSWRKKSARN
jgi:hypothetical protein